MHSVINRMYVHEKCEWTSVFRPWNIVCIYKIDTCIIARICRVGESQSSAT